MHAVHPLIVLGVWGQLVEAHLIPGEALRKADLQEGVRYQTAQPGAYLTARTIPMATCVALGIYDDRILLFTSGLHSSHAFWKLKAGRHYIANMLSVRRRLKTMMYWQLCPTPQVPTQQQCWSQTSWLVGLLCTSSTASWFLVSWWVHWPT